VNNLAQPPRRFYEKEHMRKPGTTAVYRPAAIGLLLILLLGLLAACGPSAPPTDSAETTTNSNNPIPTRANLLGLPDNAANPLVSNDGGERDANGLPVGFTADGRPYRGNPDAPIVLEEFSDFECPFCSRFTLQTLPQLMQNQMAAGEVVLIYYDFPLTSIHPQAEPAANAARCAGDQGAAAYWEMHDILYARLREWNNRRAPEFFLNYANELGLDMVEFADCVDSNKYLDAVRADTALGVSRGVSSTPSFFINEQPLIGAQPIDVFNQAIATVLNGGELTAAQAANQPPPTPTPVPISDEGVAARLGSPDAPYTIVEFTDFGCAPCARYAADTLPKIIDLLVEPGQVTYLLKDAPDPARPEAKLASVAARCAGEQEAYWPMHEALFATQEVWVGNNVGAGAYFNTLAADLGLDEATFSGCLDSGQFDAAIATAVAEAQSVEVGALPFLFIEGYPISGAEPNNVSRALGLPMDVAVANSHALGDPNAPIMMVEFTDYQCPFCTRHFAETLPLLKQNFIDTGLVYYVVKDFPLTSIHPQAVKAAEAARCAGEQGAFVPMHEALFTSQSQWSGNPRASELFIELATALGLDQEEFSDCLNSGRMETAVLADLEEGMSLGVSGTPAFFINGFLVSGALPYADFEAGLNRMLAENRE
jgi:protein-disulfide isomerase